MSTTTEKNADVIVVPEGQYTLRVMDRADCCGVQAHVKAVLVESGTALLFCRKHYLEHKTKLLGICVVIYDESGKLYQNRAVGSEN